VSATTRLRNTTSSSTNATRRMSPIAYGARPVSTDVRSRFCAAGPPTRASGTAEVRRARSVSTTVAVCASSTDVEPETRTTTRPVGAGGVTTRASTTPGTAEATRTTVVASGAGVVTYAGAAAPGPNAATTMS